MKWTPTQQSLFVFNWPTLLIKCVSFRSPAFPLAESVPHLIIGAILKQDKQIIFIQSSSHIVTWYILLLVSDTAITVCGVSIEQIEAQTSLGRKIGNVWGVLTWRLSSQSKSKNRNIFWKYEQLKRPRRVTERNESFCLLHYENMASPQISKLFTLFFRGRLEVGNMRSFIGQ